MYKIGFTDTLLIYGGGYAGKDLMRRMEAFGYSIEAFLDKCADVLVEIEGKEVYYPDKWQGNREEAVIIVATGNPVSVANYLFSLGFQKIIYNTCQDFSEEIPFYHPEMDERFVDGAFIKRENNNVTAYVPIDLLFEENENRSEHIYVKYADSLLYLKAFEGNVTNISEIDGHSRNYAIERLNGSDFAEDTEARRLYIQKQLNIWNLKLNYGMDWFIHNPIDVHVQGEKMIAHAKDIFRILFFIVKGLQRIPAVMTVDDYDFWVNNDDLEETISYAKTHDLPTSYTLLEHPDFYYYPAARDIGGNPRIIRICEYLKREGISLEGKKVIDIGSYFGYISRFFKRIGADVTSVEFEEDRYEFSMKLNKLLHCESIEAVCGGVQDFHRENEFDVVVMLTVLYWHLDTSVGLEVIHAVDTMCRKILIWESGDEPDREKQFIFDNSSFGSYQKICETTGSGKVRELGVFMK